MKTKNNKAFTLIELLMVIIIIAILFSLIFPVLMKFFTGSHALLNGIYLSHNDRIAYLAENIGKDNPFYFDYSITNDFRKVWSTYE